MSNVVFYNTSKCENESFSYANLDCLLCHKESSYHTVLEIRGFIGHHLITKQQKIVIIQYRKFEKHHSTNAQEGHVSWVPLFDRTTLILIRPKAEVNNPTARTSRSPLITKHSTLNLILGNFLPHSNSSLHIYCQSLNINEHCSTGPSILLE